MASSSGCYTYEWEQKASWETRRRSGEHLDEAEMPEPIPEGEAAGDALGELLLTLMREGKMSATTVCKIGYWAGRAGATGLVAELGYRPTAGSGKFMQHIDTVTGMKLKDTKAQMYHVKAPGLEKYDFSRSTHSIPVTPPHEGLVKEVQANPKLLDEAKAKTEQNHWPRCYYEHPVVRRAGGDTVIPLALYVDGISMTRNDSLVGIFVYSLVTMRRHLVSVLRKSFLCKCGCGGRCTLYPVLAMIRWSMEALSAGRWPTNRHDGTPWAESDANRFQNAGKELPFKACVVYLKADWAEFSKTLGFSSWASALFPCPFCRRTKEDLHEVAGFGPVEHNWPLITHDDIERATAACERHVTLDEKTHQLVLKALQYQKQKNGPRGRALTHDLPVLQLRKGDRLEPTPWMMDVAEFDDVTRFPFRAVFWRRSSETRVTFRNPLWDLDLGLQLEVLAIDILHTVYLGSALFFVGFCLWLFVDGDFWRLGENLSKDGRWQNNIQHLRTLMQEYYRDLRRARPGRPATEVENLTINMLGSSKTDIPNFKAAETKHLVPFMVKLLREVQGLPQPLSSQLLSAGEAMLAFIKVVDEGPPNLPPSSLQVAHDSYKKFIRMCSLAKVPLRPKGHLFGHLVQRSDMVGNPRMYSTFEDESLNAVLKAMGAAAHRSVWAYRVFCVFASWEDGHSRKRTRQD